jgi:hypothetical protein
MIDNQFNAIRAAIGDDKDGVLHPLQREMRLHMICAIMDTLSNRLVGAKRLRYICWRFCFASAQQHLGRRLFTAYRIFY